MTIDEKPNVIFLPFPRDLYDDWARHSSAPIEEAAVEQLWNFMERTLADGSPGYFDDHEQAFAFAEKNFPDIASEWVERDLANVRPSAPLIWKEVSIQHGSGVRMSYGGEDHLAEVENGKIVDASGRYSPSEWASKVAQGTSRNAWRDLWFREPFSRSWIPAQLLRDQAQKDMHAKFQATPIEELLK